MAKTQLLLFALLLINVVGDAADAGIELPPPTGLYPAGTVRYSFIDRNRPESFTPAENDFREVAVKIWYPAQDTAGLERAPYLEKAPERKAQLPAHSPLPPHFFEAMAGVYSHSYIGAEISDREAQYPIILFSHAYGAGMSANTVLMEELASHGYIAISIGHAFETSHFIRSDGSLTVFPVTNPEFIQRGRERQNTYTLQRKINDTEKEDELRFIIRELMDQRPKSMESLQIWVADISFIIDRLEEINRSDTIFRQKLDLEKIGVMGHSFGGAAAGQACLVEKRCKAGINLDGLQIGDMLSKPLEKPFLFMHHDNAGAVNKTPNRLFFRQSHSRAYLLLIKGTTHFSFSDLALPCYARILGTPPGLAGSIDGYRCLQIQNDYVCAFFDKHLRHQNVALLNRPSDKYPEVEITVK